MSREHSESWHHRVEIWYDASNGSFWWENGPSAAEYGISQLSSIHFNICLIWLICCNAENACYEACVFEMLVALWRVDWVWWFHVWATLGSRGWMPYAKSWWPLMLVEWVRSDDFDSGGSMVQTRCWTRGILPIVAVCCCGHKTSLRHCCCPLLLLHIIRWMLSRPNSNELSLVG